LKLPTSFESAWFIVFYLGGSVTVLLSTFYFATVLCDIDRKYLGEQNDAFCNFSVFTNSSLGVILLAPIIIGLYLLAVHLRNQKNANLNPKGSPRVASVLAILAPIPIIFLGLTGWGMGNEYLGKQCMANAEEAICAHGLAAYNAGLPMVVIWSVLGITVLVLACVYNRILPKV
jgi:hypothetical protein